MVVTLGQQYNVGVKRVVIIVYDNNDAIEPYKNRCPCMAINASVQYNDGAFYHRGRTRLNAMERFCLCSL